MKVRCKESNTTYFGADHYTYEFIMQSVDNEYPIINLTVASDKKIYEVGQVYNITLLPENLEVPVPCLEHPS